MNGITIVGWSGRRPGCPGASSRPCGCAAAAKFLGVVTYDSDSGRLSAAFVWERLLRVTAPQPPAVRYVICGWTSVIERLAARARGDGAFLAGDMVAAPGLLGEVSINSAIETARGHCRLGGGAPLTSYTSPLFSRLGVFTDNDTTGTEESALSNSSMRVW